jgi:molecular chaperone GrpE
MERRIGMSERAEDQAQAPAQAGSGPETDESIDADLESLRQKAEEHWNSYLRVAADLENLRRRSAREVESARKYGAERLANALLPVRDSLEAALAADNATRETLLEGTRATLRLLDQALAGAGIGEIDPHGEPFDPTKHEALSMRPAPDVEPGTVVEVVQKGYALNDRLLRPARVIVGAAPPTQQPD